MPTKTQAKPLFAATLTPHRSLTPRGKRVVIALVAALALVPGFVFYVAGAWPVVGFMGLDVLAIWAALTISMRSGRAYEVLTLWPGALELKRVDPKGQEDVLSFEPFNVRFVIDRDFNERVTGLWLKERERKVPLGAFLSTDEKLSLSKVFGSALRKARA
ncbi:MAG: DUF2244 domain-containing protein [Devosia nanyangense]|uniref:DUF2244 domain-containing protein n=1 Tax=Devosia nanyangense TaxID=1228055 RepID=A0A933NWT1_9HYPH|nr:DUF2244 domain-containing protein [Devosia nanyangense]